MPTPALAARLMRPPRLMFVHAAGASIDPDQGVHLQMQAWRKVREAQFFYTMMIEKAEDYEHFSFCLSAFLAACRSVKDYLQKEEPILDSWYTTEDYEHRPVIEYFRNRRDLEVHFLQKSHYPIAPVQEKLTLNNSGDEPPFDFLTMDGTNPDGSPRTEAIVGDFAPPLSLDDPGMPPVAPPGMHSRLYVFEDHPGIPHDVVDGCRAYLLEMRQLVKDAEQFLTP